MEKDVFIYLFGFKIFEPVTVLTNIIIVTMSFIFYLKIKKDPQRKDINAWRLFFFHIATSAFVGCFVHGVHELWGVRQFEIIKIIRNILTLLAAYYSFKACLLLVQKNEKVVKNVMLWLNIYICGAMLVTIFFNQYVIIIINTGLFILYTLYAHIISYKKGNAGSGWILAAFGIAPFPILIHLLKIGNNIYFNSKDIAHVFIWISLWFLYKGVKVMAATKTTT